MPSIDTFLSTIQNKWNKVLPALKKEALQSLFENQTLIDFNEQTIPNLPNDFGVYLFQINPKQLFDINILRTVWESDNTLKFTPNISLSRFKCDKPNSWYPFYVGKAEKLSIRINQHCFQDFNKPTYGLKLKHRIALLEKATFSVGYYKLAHTNKVDKNVIQFVLTNLEREVRNEVNSWIGKQ